MRPRPLVFALVLAGGCGDAPPGPSDPAPSPSEPGKPVPDDRTLQGPGFEGPVFEGRLELRTEGLPEGVLIHDLNGDGRPELLAATRSPGSLHLWKSPLSSPEVTSIGDYPLGPLAVPRAERTWVAVAPRSVPELLLMDPWNSDVAPIRHALPGTPRAMGVGDLDDDGEFEVVLALREGALVLVDGAATRTLAQLEERLPTCLAVVSGAVIVGFQASETLRAYVYGDGGACSPAAPVSLDAIPRDLLLRGDELLVAAGDNELLALSLPGILEGSARPRRQPGVPSVPIALAASNDELLVLGHGSLSFSRIGAGTDPEHHFAGQDVWDAALGDLDGDGALDLAVANRGASRVSWMRGTPSGAFDSGHFVEVGRGPHSVTATDLDGDGTLELCVLEAMLDRLTVLERTGLDYQVRQHLPARPAADRVTSADVDGDGHVDVGFLVRDDSGARLRVHLGNAEGQLQAESTECRAGTGTGDLLWLDLDQDGRPEALISDPATGFVFVIGWNDGELQERTRVSVPSAPRGMSAGPGRSVAVALGAPGPRTGYAWLLAEGAGPDLRLREVAHVESSYYGIDIATLDDAVALLAQPDLGDGPGRLVLHDIGTGEVMSEVSTGQRPYALGSGDVDGDGRRDLAVGAQNSHQVNVWLRRGDGGLVRLPDLGVGRGILDVVVVDVDGDGKADVVGTNNFSNDLSVVRAR